MGSEATDPSSDVVEEYSSASSAWDAPFTEPSWATM